MENEENSARASSAPFAHVDDHEVLRGAGDRVVVLEERDGAPRVRERRAERADLLGGGGGERALPHVRGDHQRVEQLGGAQTRVQQCAEQLLVRTRREVARPVVVVAVRIREEVADERRELRRLQVLVELLVVTDRPEILRQCAEFRLRRETLNAINYQSNSI